MLIPDTTTCGFCGSAARTPYSTVSAGKPLTAVAASPDPVVAGTTVTLPLVKFVPVPLWFVAGAMTVTSTFGSACSALTSTLIPGAATPSSLVTRIRRGSSTRFGGRSRRRPRGGERAARGNHDERDDREP